MKSAKKQSSVGCVGCLIPLGLAFLVYVGSLQWGFHVQSERNAAIGADVALVVRALGSFAAAHRGLYPEGKALVLELSPFLPDRRMPENPWAPQGVRLPVLALDDVSTDSGLDHKPWPSAANLAAGGQLPAIGVHLYSGPRGALIYDVSPDRRAYVVYGLGERSSPDSPSSLKSPKLVAAATSAR